MCLLKCQMQRFLLEVCIFLICKLFALPPAKSCSIVDEIRDFLVRLNSFSVRNSKKNSETKFDRNLNFSPFSKFFRHPLKIQSLKGLRWHHAAPDKIPPWLLLLVCFGSLKNKVCDDGKLSNQAFDYRNHFNSTSLCEKIKMLSMLAEVKTRVVLNVTDIFFMQVYFMLCLGFIFCENVDSENSSVRFEKSHSTAIESTKSAWKSLPSECCRFRCSNWEIIERPNAIII